MDRKYMKTPDTLDRENRELRGLLRRLAELDLSNLNESALCAIQSDAVATLDRMDGRKLGAGFTRPDVREKAGAQARAQQASFLGEVGPILKEMQAAGLSYRGMADALNERKIAAPKGGAWAAGSVKFQMVALAKLKAMSG